jgi:uncharacterized protein (UPF0335 family)
VTENDRFGNGVPKMAHNSGADEAELEELMGSEDSKPVDVGSASDTDEKRSDETGGVAGERLRSFIQRVERLEEDKKCVADDIREVYAEAKSNGFDPKIMRQVIKLRKMEAADRAEQEALLETYLHALGMMD